MSERSIDRKGSSTAGYTCFTRACSTREEIESFRGPDYMAEIFLPLFAKIMLNVPWLRRLCMSRMFPSGIYEYVTARTKLFDEIFLDALGKGFSQIVILGAGMDTRALRFAGKNKGTRIFELDIEKTQKPKIEILSEKRVPLPDVLVFVPIDFNKESLSDALLRAGYVKNQKTLFLWEGVTMYLNAEAVDSTLQFIRKSSQPGSLVVFDYIYASVLRRENRYYGEEEIFHRVSSAGEGWTFGLEEDAIGDYLAERGFTLVSHFTPAQLQEKYLTAEDGRTLGRINGTHCNVVAMTGAG
jgi:methyltransferase (TIGR00027 family)